MLGLKSQLFHFKSDLYANFRRCSSDSKDCNWLGFQSQLDLLMADFEHKEIFVDQKSQLCRFNKSDLSERFRRCLLDSKDCHWLSFQSQLDHLMANFEHSEVFY